MLLAVAQTLSPTFCRSIGRWRRPNRPARDRSILIDTTGSTDGRANQTTMTARECPVALPVPRSLESANLAWIDHPVRPSVYERSEATHPINPEARRPRIERSIHLESREGRPGWHIDMGARRTRQASANKQLATGTGSPGRVHLRSIESVVVGSRHARVLALGHELTTRFRGLGAPGMAKAAAVPESSTRCDVHEALPFAEARDARRRTDRACVEMAILVPALLYLDVGSSEAGQRPYLRCVLPCWRQTTIIWWPGSRNCRVLALPVSENLARQEDVVVDGDPKVQAWAALEFTVQSCMALLLVAAAFNELHGSAASSRRGGSDTDAPDSARATHPDVRDTTSFKNEGAGIHSNINTRHRAHLIYTLRTWPSPSPPAHRTPRVIPRRSPSDPPPPMAKRLFHSCRSPSAAAAVTPTSTLLRSEHPPVTPAPTSASCYPRRRASRQRPQPPASCGAGGCAVDYNADDLPPARGTPAYRWLKSSRWHVVEAAANAASDGDDDDTPRLKIDTRRRVRHSRRRRRRVLLQHKAAAAGPASWSSGDSGWFSSDDEDDDTFGADSSSSALPVASSTTTTTESSSTGASGKSDAAAVAGGFAVVKRSDDPRGDFRRSMAEMVVGRGIYDADGLERLLRCFLALNDRRHRRDIVAAFGDVWEAVFANPPPSSRSHGASAFTSGDSSGKAAAAKPERKGEPLFLPKFHHHITEGTPALSHCHRPWPTRTPRSH
ncbi:hypothetical protein HU200_003890 [Digitaria exilis]|uniref:OVATE domain-containing protein n=1 Tax=Digitaria exilis TaxID=1010633 RepID=A0A835FUI2_9POAL|nr:hypothetical protein HU200_003890 [Digitaria exilis]